MVVKQPPSYAWGVAHIVAEWQVGCECHRGGRGRGVTVTVFIFFKTICIRDKTCSSFCHPSASAAIKCEGGKNFFFVISLKTVQINGTLLTETPSDGVKGGKQTHFCGKSNFLWLNLSPKCQQCQNRSINNLQLLPVIIGFYRQTLPSASTPARMVTFYSTTHEPFSSFSPRPSSL